MEKTKQVNIRIPISLIYEMEKIARFENIDKSAWLKLQIVKAVERAKDNLLDKLEIKFVKGRIGNREFKEYSGFEPRKEIRELRKERLFRNLKTDGFTRFKKQLLAQLKDQSNEIYFDSYFQEVITAINKIKSKKKK